MSGWVCDSCESNNLAGATVCRVCQRAPGSTTGMVRAVPPAAAPPTPPPQITLTPVPTARAPKPPAPPKPPPVRKPPAAPVYPRPPARPVGPSVSGRQVWRVVKFVGLGLLLIGLANNCDSFLHLFPTGDSTAAPRSTSSACPTAAASWLPGGGAGATLVAAYTTEKHVITVCQTGSGQLYYDGQVRGSAPNTETHISIPAEQTSSGFVARNKSYVYEITGTEVIVTQDGTTRARWTLTRTAP